MAKITLKEALKQASVVDELKNFVGLTKDDAVGLMTPERLAAVAGGLKPLTTQSIILKDEAFKLGIIMGGWTSKQVSIFGSCEDNPVNIVLAHQKTDSEIAVNAVGKSSNFIGLYHDGKNIYLKNKHRQHINVSLRVISDDTIESIGVVADISKWTPIVVKP